MVQEIGAALAGAFVGWVIVKLMWPRVWEGEGPLAGAAFGGVITFWLAVRLMHADVSTLVDAVFGFAALSHQEISGVLMCIFVVWLIARRDRHLLLVSWLTSFCLSIGAMTYFAMGESVTVISIISANLTLHFGFGYFWRYVGGTKGKGLLASTMFAIPILLFYTCPSFPNFSESLLRILSSAALGLFLGAPVGWVLMEGIKR